MVGAPGWSKRYKPAILIDLELVQSTMANFHIDTDKIAIGRINESLSTLQQARDLRIRDAETALKSDNAPNHLRKSSKADLLIRVIT